jgi:YidC/Oxa1 family membrane protein insertase
MKFYAENKINPFASCLPLVAQMPFFIGLFYLLRNDLRVEICGKALHLVAHKPPPCGTIAGANGAEKFLFIPDLTAQATGWVLAVLIVLYVGSQLLSSVLTPSTADKNQKMLMYALPFVFVIFVRTFPAGLIVYWITTNFWTVAQGYILRKRMGPISAPKDAEPVLAGIPAPAGRGGGFMARLAAVTGGAASDGDGAEPEERKNGRGVTAPRKPPDKDRAPAAAAAKSGGGRNRASRPTAESSGTSAAPPAAKPARSGPPPPPPRKKKKRSGRRR